MTEWTDDAEIEELSLLRRGGMMVRLIAKRLGRKTEACEWKLGTLGVLKGNGSDQERAACLLKAEIAAAHRERPTAPLYRKWPDEFAQ